MFRSYMVEPVRDYVTQAGLWHSWDMFSPNPLSVNFNVEAHIDFGDGSKKVWTFPRMERLGMWERFQKERFRKWRERVRQDSYRNVWDDTCRFIARLHDSPTNRPVRVSLVRQWAAIPPPKIERGKSLLDYQPIPNDYELTLNFQFKQYIVQPEDL